MAFAGFQAARTENARTGDEYRGMWNGKKVSFPKTFRGYVFSDEECAALCRGEMLEVHGLEQDGVRYSVVGCLKESRFPGISRDFETVAFRAVDTVAFNPDYRFVSRKVQYAGDPQDEIPIRKSDGAIKSLPDKHPFPAEHSVWAETDRFPDVEEIPYEDPEEFDAGEERDMFGNQMEATVRAMTYPIVINFAPPEQPPVFVPLFELFSDDGVKEAVNKLAANMT